ncbi:MAG: peptidase M24, partial [Bacillota bacterium]|nr:peptidase M24 [Bacillota bacterium]
MVKSPFEKVYDFIEQKKIDGVFFRKRSNFSWITGGKVNHIVQTTEYGVADIIIFLDKKYCVTSKMESQRILKEELEGQGFEFVTLEWFENQDSIIQGLCRGKVLASDVHFDPFLDFGTELTTLRYTLTNEEIDRYRWISQKAAFSVETTCREIEQGWTEYEIAANLASKVIKDGINPHVILVATDERIFKFRHPIPTEKPLRNYAMIVICAEKWGLVANVTRFVHFGKLPKEIEINCRKLAQIDIVMNEATRPGIQIKDILQQGIDMYREIGFPEDWRYLHQGGPTGYATREFLATPEVKGEVQLH